MSKWTRALKRERKQQNYHANGLNGPRAVARRQRQRLRREAKRLAQ